MQGTLSAQTAPSRGRRRTTLAAVCAWAVCALTLVIAGLGLWLLALTYTVDFGPHWGPRGFLVLFAVDFAAIGTLLTLRQPRNVVGWLFALSGLIGAVQLAAEGYAVLALLVQPGRSPGGLFSAWLQSWIWIPGACLIIIFVLLYFPDGHLPSTRWRVVAIAAALVTMVASVAYALKPGGLENFTVVENPLAIGMTNEAWTALSVALFSAMVACVFAAVASLFWRLRTAGPELRQQLKWVAYAAGLIALGALAGFALPNPGAYALIGSMVALPIAIGVAILRYRLYDIDIIIRRTLVYGALTSLLAGIYFGSVVILQALLGGLTGQRQSELVTVLSTLTIAALFTPLRGRLQKGIDRRFYRYKYDAARALAAFSAAARNEVDLDQLSTDLQTVVSETVQPTEVTLWLKPGPNVRRE